MPPVAKAPSKLLAKIELEKPMTIRPKSPTRHLYTTTTTILVGPSPPASFQVHTPLLETVPFFRAALSKTSCFLEAANNSISLPEVTPSMFTYFIQYLYTQSLAHEELDQNQPAFFWLIRMWKLAGFFRYEKLRNAVLDEVAMVSDKFNAVPSPDDTRELWGEGGEGTGFRGLVLDLFLYKNTNVLIDTHEDSWDERFLRELVIRLKVCKRVPDVPNVPMVSPWGDKKMMCIIYHEHKETATCVDWTEKVDIPNATTATLLRALKLQEQKLR